MHVKWQKNASKPPSSVDFSRFGSIQNRERVCLSFSYRSRSRPRFFPQLRLSLQLQLPKEGMLPLGFAIPTSKLSALFGTRRGREREETPERQSLFNAHRRSRWISFDLGSLAGSRGCRVALSRNPATVATQPVRAHEVHSGVQEVALQTEAGAQAVRIATPHERALGSCGQG